MNLKKKKENRSQSCPTEEFYTSSCWNFCLVDNPFVSKTCGITGLFLIRQILLEVEPFLSACNPILQPHLPRPQTERHRWLQVATRLLREPCPEFPAFRSVGCYPAQALSSFPSNCTLLRRELFKRCFLTEELFSRKSCHCPLLFGEVFAGLAGVAGLGTLVYGPPGPLPDWVFPTPLLLVYQA